MVDDWAFNHLYKHEDNDPIGGAKQAPTEDFINNMQNWQGENLPTSPRKGGKGFGEYGATELGAMSADEGGQDQLDKERDREWLHGRPCGMQRRQTRTI